MRVTRYTRKKTLLLFLTLLLSGTALAQSNDSLVVFYFSEPGLRPSQIFTDGFESGNTSRWDFNGDNFPDLILTRENEQGNLQGIVVVGRPAGAASLDTLWRFTDIPPDLDGMRLFGFGDGDGDGTREAIFAGPDNVALIDPRSNTLNWALNPEDNTKPVRLFGMNDITNDGFVELSVALRGTRQVQVWTANN